MIEAKTTFFLSALSTIPSALLALSSATLSNFEDGSICEFATAAWSISDNIDLVFGANVGFGGLGTEFGGFSEAQAGVEFKVPDLCFAFLKFYF